MAGRVFPLLLALLILVGCSSDLPRIDDPGQLLKECEALAAQVPAGNVERKQWPPSVRKLNPQQVKKSSGGVFITTYMKTGSGVRGYVVDNQPPTPAEHYRYSPTGYAGIYRFDFQP